MPVRFQVDADFYDHPKTIDLSDAAVALWTRAGSYSTHKLLDGFVPDGMLARLSRAADEASAELIRHGLWKRVRGGFRFHQWDHRNLTKAEVEADRVYEREKKRRQRSERKPQASNGSVPTGLPEGIPGESLGSPDRSVSVSESVSESISKDRQTSSVLPRKRGTRIADDFTVNASMVTWARDNTPNVDGRLETEKFVNYWRAKTGRDATKLDWVATWRNWMLTASQRNPPRRPANSSEIDWAAAMARAEEREAATP